MAKFLSRLFGGGSSSSKPPSFRSSQTALNDTSRQTGTAASNMRPAISLDNLSSYHVNPKELDKSKLHKASWEGNLNKVERLVRPDQINTKDQHKRTPLHLAVARGHLDIVKYLVHEGARLDVTDYEQRTPLVKAVLSGSQNPQLTYQICVALLDGGADAFINAVDIQGKNALHYAVDFDHDGLVDLFLLVRNCDPNFRDRDQMTPLHLAVKRKNPDTVRILLSEQHEQQSDPNLTNRNGQTPLHMAAIAGNDQIIQILLQSNLEEPCDPTMVDSQQLTAYQIARANHHDACAQIIHEYQEGWTKGAAHANRSGSTNEQAINPIITDPSKRFEDDQDETTETSSTSETSRSLKTTPGQFKRPSNEWSERTNLSTSAPKSETRSLADIIKSNPLQPGVTNTTIPKPSNQVLTNLVTKNPLQLHEASSQPHVSIQQKQVPPVPGIGPTVLKYRETDNTSTSSIIEQSIIGTNLIAEPPSTLKKNVTINALVNTIPHPEPMASNTNSWSQDTTSIHKQEYIIKAKKVDKWDGDSSASTIQSDNEDYDIGVYNTKPTSINFPNPQTFSTTNPATSRQGRIHDSTSDDDSIEAAVLKLNIQQPPSNTIQTLVNKQIGSNYQVSQQTSVPSALSPVSDDSSWTTSSVPPKQELLSKGVNSLIQQQPLLTQKASELTLDDSRPLSADLQRTIIKSKTPTSPSSPEDSDYENNEKSSTIVKSPFTHGVLSNIVQANIRPTESLEPKPSGIDNLAKIMGTIMHPPVLDLKQSTPPPKTISQLVTSPLLEHSDSFSSDASSLTSETTRALKMPSVGMGNLKQQIYNEDIDEKNWTSTMTSRRDFTLITRKNSNEMIQHSHVLTSRTSGHPDINNLLGSMSSSTSSIQNNMERITELKEDIKQIERKQEDSRELKRQLKDMENKKNNFEALYKKNDQLLRETETKLEKEINEKQRLEWTTKNLNMELKSIKQKLESLEDEKDILNQRCIKLKEERDNYDEKIRLHQVNTIQSTTTGLLREEDIEKIKLRHREEMKLLSAENEDLHQRTKQLQSDLQLHRESLDVTIRYKIDLEKALDEKTYLQRELDRLKHEKDFIEQEKTDYKTKCESLQEEIRIIVLDRSKLEQKFTQDLQEETKQRQRSSDDSKKYKTQIEQLNMKLGDAEARLLVLQTQNEALLASKDRTIKNEFDTLTHRLNLIESEKFNAEQRYHNEYKEIANKQQQQQQQPPPSILHEPLGVLTSTSLNNLGQQQQYQHSPASSCVKCNTLQRSYEHEHEQRLQSEKDNERLRNMVSRQENKHFITEDSKQMRSETEHVKYELDRLRQDFDKLVSNYDPSKSFQQPTPIHSQTDLLRQLYEQELREKQLLLSKLTNGKQPTANGYHGTSISVQHHEYDHLSNGNIPCSICSNSRLLKERLANAIDTSLADQRIQTIKQIPILPRQTSPLLTTTNTTSSVDILRKRYYV